MPRTLRFTSVSNPNSVIEVEQTLQDPYEPDGDCAACGKPKFRMHYNVTIHPESYSHHLPENQCACDWWIEDSM